MSYRINLHSISSLFLAFIVSIGFLQASTWLAAAQADAEPAFCTGTVRIMPLGDSITLGSSSGESDVTKQIAYRKDLWELLQAANYSVDFVGSLTNGEFYSGFDANHEGHASKTDSYVASNVYNWLVTNPADIVLLHIGTNGLDSDPGDVEEILDQIDLYESTGKQVWVILARIINRITYSSTTKEFNDNIQAMAEARIANLGDKIVIVDMENGANIAYASYLVGGDMWDDIHPYHTGYAKMATVWKDGIDQVFDQVCNGPPTITTELNDRENSETSEVSIQVNATDPEGDPLEFSADGLPEGLSIDPASGLISGTISCVAAASSPYNTSVTATDTVSLKKDVKNFTWTVTDVNCPPQVVQPDNQLHPEGASVNLQIVASDPDNGDDLQVSAPNLPPGLTLNPSDGWITGIVSYEAYTGTLYTVQVTATDNGSPVLSDSKTFTWTITNVNRPPVFNVLPGNQSNDEGDSISFPILASDPDLGDTVSYSTSVLPEGLAIDPASGLIGGILSYNASIGSLHPVSVTVSDGSDQETANFIWEVANRNGPPQVDNPGSQTDGELNPVDLEIKASDPDQNDSISFSLGSGSFLPLSLHLDPDTGVISGVIESGASADSPYSVTVVVTDSGSPQLSSQVTFDWNVVPYNFPPPGSMTVFLPLVVH